MGMNMTTNSLQSARSRVEAATAGEWQANFCHWGKSHITAIASPVGRVDTHYSINGMPMVKITEADLRPEDAELIVLAVNTLKRLLSEEGQEVIKAAVGRGIGHYMLAGMSIDEIREGVAAEILTVILGDQTLPLREGER